MSSFQCYCWLQNTGCHGYHAIAFGGVLLMSSKLNPDKFQESTKEFHVLKVRKKGFHLGLVSLTQKRLHLNCLVLMIVVHIFLWAR